MGRGKGSRVLLKPDELMPSRPDSDDRQLRRQLEKAHGYGYSEVILLALLGITTICNVEKSLKHCEERHRKNEIEEMRARDAERWREEEEKAVRRLQGTRVGKGRGGGSPSYRGSAPPPPPPPSSLSSSSRSKGSSKESRGRDWRRDDGRRGSGAITTSGDTRDGHHSYSRDGGSQPRYYDDGCVNQYDGRYGDRYDDRYDSRYDDHYYDRRRARSAERHSRRGSL
ncbi:hypothetical protein DL768_011716 [Monosporascus sp. mg162]|nr:hypothetical protein DL768_011716 [Monosporascus sp. mg162]